MLFHFTVILAQGTEITELSPLLNLIANGGIAVIVFIIWFFTFRYLIKQHEKIIQKYEKLVEETKSEYQNVIEKTEEDHAKIIDRFIGVIEKTMEQSNFTAGMLLRVESIVQRLIDKLHKLEN